MASTSMNIGDQRKFAHHRRCHTDPSNILIDFGGPSSASPVFDINESLSIESNPACTSPSSVQRCQSDCNLSILEMNCKVDAIAMHLKLRETEKEALKNPSLTKENTTEERDETSDDARREGCTRSNSKPNVARRDLLPELLECIVDEKWKKVQDFLEEDPSLTKRQVKMVCQGENSKCLLVHLLCSKRSTPISIFDTLVTMYPGSLLQTEGRGGRLPLHIALLRNASTEVIRCLYKAKPEALKVPDQEGNYPAHFVAMYGSSATIQLVIAAYPDACRITNRRDRLPLHLLCARCFDSDTVRPNDAKMIVDAFPQGAKMCDRFGRLPLHLAAQVQNPQWDFLEVLINNYPQALLHKDKTRLTPLALAKKSPPRSFRTAPYDLVVASLTECTIRERRKEHPYMPQFLFKAGSQGMVTKRKKKTVDLYNCYG